VRRDNEDSIFASPEYGVFVVADGMGGHAAGEVASAIASETIGSRLCAGDMREPEASARAVRRAFAAADEEILRQARADERRAGMGTTATALVLQSPGRWTVGHVGDSRAYLLRDGALRRITRDHSWVQEQVERGTIRPEQARGHPQSNIITRALGTTPGTEPEIYSDELRDGDRFLLASDGLTDMVEETRIEEILDAADDPSAAVNRLVESANAAGGVDNVTAIVVDVGASPEAGSG
jgi:protein phosphatase